MVPRASALLVALLFFSPGSAVALSRAEILALEVVVETPSPTRAFGRLGAFMAALKRAGHICAFAPYEHGVNVGCAKKGAPPDVFIDFVFVPSRGPDRAAVGEVRTNGINGGFLADAEKAGFLSGYSGVRAKAAP